MQKVIFLLLLVFFLAGCASIESIARSQINFINYSSVIYPAKSKDTPVDLYFQDSPTKPYEVIGEFVGTADNGDQVRPILEARIRQVGGDGAINIKTWQGSKIESEIVKTPVSGPRGYIKDVPVAQTYTYNVINIKAKVIRYK